jgi:signal transduction histidine kinase
VKGKSKINLLTGVLANALTYRNRVVIIIIGLVLGLVSMFVTSNMARQLRDKEQHEVELWGYAISFSGVFGSEDNELMDRMMASRSNIPTIVLDDNSVVRQYYGISDKVVNHPDLLREELVKLARQNDPLTIRMRLTGDNLHIFYGKSSLQRMLINFPVIQIGVIVIFIIFGFIAFSSSKEDEQNKVWIGLAKETAHQLGTPISSLLGWVEYLRSQPIEQGMVEEMQNDLVRLMKVTDRFSKIGSETILSPANVNEVVGNSVMYFRSRIPRNVTLDYNGLAIAPVSAMLNAALFEWVVENLLKNSLDALQGQGAINVVVSSDEDSVYIDTSDTGKGIPKANFKRIFEPGFSTKTRGWGLGLSLSKRIIEEYHNGKIFVADSEPGKGATFRISLKRIYE